MFVVSLLSQQKLKSIYRDIMYAFRKIIAAAVLILAANAVAAAQANAKATAKGPKPIHQLRIYEIFEHNKQAFHDRFRDHALRIMKKYDFNIVAFWETRSGEKTEFVYLIEWPDEATMTDRWAKFRADKEWAEIKKETAAKYGDLVGDIQDRTLHLTDYSPRSSLLK